MLTDTCSRKTPAKESQQESLNSNDQNKILANQLASNDLFKDCEKFDMNVSIIILFFNRLNKLFSLIYSKTTLKKRHVINLISFIFLKF